MSISTMGLEESSAVSSVDSGSSEVSSSFVSFGLTLGSSGSPVSPASPVSPVSPVSFVSTSSSPFSSS